MTIDIKEVLRYLGHRAEADDELIALIRRSADEILKVTKPKRNYCFLEPVITDNSIDFGKMTIESRDLAKNLAGCEEAALFCATLGIGPDLLIKQAAVGGMLRAAVMQAVCTDLIEQVCDEVESEILKERPGFYARPRFSAGYGDCALEHQKDILRILDAQRKAGITLTDGNLMVPTKSVTAFVGLSRQETKRKKVCDCALKDCACRREE